MNQGLSAHMTCYSDTFFLPFTDSKCIMFNLVDFEEHVEVLAPLKKKKKLTLMLLG